MNVAFFLTPKSEVVWVRAEGTLDEAIERLRRSGYAAVPVLDDAGRYVGTLSEGDVLWHLLDAGEGWSVTARRTPVFEVAKRARNLPVHIDAEVEALIARASDQNFVPVLDDRDVFIGIVPRKAIIERCARPAATARTQS